MREIEVYTVIPPTFSSRCRPSLQVLAWALAGGIYNSRQASNERAMSGQLLNKVDSPYS